MCTKLLNIATTTTCIYSSFIPGGLSKSSKELLLDGEIMFKFIVSLTIWTSYLSNLRANGGKQERGQTLLICGEQTIHLYLCMLKSCFIMEDRLTQAISRQQLPCYKIVADNQSILCHGNLRGNCTQLGRVSLLVDGLAGGTVPSSVRRRSCRLTNSTFSLLNLE